MNYTKTTILTMSVVLLALGCKPEEEPDNTPVKAAIKLETVAVRSNSVEIEMQCQQSSVVSYLVTPPALTAEVNYLDMDAVGQYEYIKNNGNEVKGTTYTYTGLAKQSEYVVGAVGLDAKGKVASAPYFLKFTTPNFAITATAGYEKNSDGGYTFSGVINATDPSVSTFRYIFDKEHTELQTAELVELLKSNDEAVKTENGGSSKTVTATEPGTATYILAAIPYDSDNNAGEIVVAFASCEKLVTLDYNGATKMQNTKGDIYEATVDLTAAAEFTVTVSNEKYGFLPYSGAGGVGTINRTTFTGLYSAYPSYNSSSQEYLFSYEVSKAKGRMDKVSASGKNFFANCTGKVKVVIDLGETIPRYYLERVQEEDPSLILNEDFSLFVYSGDYMNAASGTELALTLDHGQIDGTEPGEKQRWNMTNNEGANKNEVAMHKVFDYPALTVSGQDLRCLASEAYIRNRGLEGWTCEAIGEKAGCVQLSIASGPYYGKLTTPKIGEAAGSNIIVEIDMARMSTGSKKPIGVEIVGAGSYVSASMTRDAFRKTKGDAPTGGTSCPSASKDFADVSNNTVTLDSGEDSGFISEKIFAVKTDLYPASFDNGHIAKPHTHLRLEVSGANADTQIKINTGLAGEGSNASDTRIFVFDVKITKK